MALPMRPFIIGYTFVSLLQTKFTITMRKISTDHNDHAVQSLDTLPKKCFKWKVAVEIHKQ